MANTNEYAAGVMQHLVTHDGDGGHGYTWGNRWGDGTNETISVLGQPFTVRNGDRDCSSGVISAWEAVVPGSTGGATYTGNMRRCFTSTGLWEWKPLSFIASPGDIYLNESNHTSMCKQQVPDELMEFRINEFGEVYGGKQGDQNGRESGIGGYYDYPWDGILHYVGGTIESEYEVVEGNLNADIKFEVHTEDGWLGIVTKCDDTEEGYGGWRGKPIDGIRAYRTDGSTVRIQAIMDDGTEWSATEFTNSLWGSNTDGDGYAGDIDSGRYIIGLRVFGAKCRVKAGGGWLGWTEGSNPTPEGDDFAGEDLWKKQPITAVQMKI